MKPHGRPVLLVSGCLAGERCRYDGSSADDAFVESLAPFCEVRTACPEVGIGLGVPRPPIRLVTDGSGGALLIQPSTGRDLTAAMEAFSAALLSDPGGLDGAVLKSRSPSCGISDVRIHSGVEGHGPVGTGPGAFGRAVLEALGGRPVIHEGRLSNLRLREHFLTSVFTLARFRTAARECAERGASGPLVSFHASAKLLLSASNREEGRRMGRLVAGGGRDEVAEYGSSLVRAVARPLRIGPCVDALMHAFGYFKKDLSSAEKAFFLDCLEDFAAGRTAIGICSSLIRSWTVRFGVSYLDDQILFDPYPPALASTADSARGAAPRE